MMMWPLLLMMMWQLLLMMMRLLLSYDDATIIILFGLLNFEGTARVAAEVMTWLFLLYDDVTIITIFIVFWGHCACTCGYITAICMMLWWWWWWWWCDCAWGHCACCRRGAVLVIWWCDSCYDSYYISRCSCVCCRRVMGVLPTWGAHVPDVNHSMSVSNTHTLSLALSLSHTQCWCEKLYVSNTHTHTHKSSHTLSHTHSCGDLWGSFTEATKRLWVFST